MEKAVNDIKSIIDEFNKSLEVLLPPLEDEIKQLIESKVVDPKVIEGLLDTLLGLTSVGKAEHLFILLLEYYKTIDADGAAFYWNEFDGEDEEE